MPLQRLLQEGQGGRFIPFLRDVALKDLTFAINGSSQIVPPAVDLYEHLIKVPAPLAIAAHAANALPPNVSRKHWAKSIPPQPHRLMANIDPALEQQVFHVALT